VFDDNWICSRCKKRVDRGRTHYKDGFRRLHVRCVNEIEAERRQKEKEQRKAAKQVN